MRVKRRGVKRRDGRRLERRTGRRSIPAWAIALLIAVLLLFGFAFYYSGSISYSPVIQEKSDEVPGFCSIKGVMEARSLSADCTNLGSCEPYNQIKARYLEECGWELP